MFKSNARTGNFSQAGKSAADDLVRSFAAARRNSPDYGKIAQTAATIRSQEKQAAIKAQSAVTKSGIQAAGDVESSKLKIKAQSELKGAQRKAGVLATAGKMFSTAGTFYGDSKDIKLRDTSDSAYDNSAITTAEGLLADAEKDLDAFNQGINPATGRPYGQRPDSNTSNETSTNSSTTTTGGTPAPKAVKPSTETGGGQNTAMRYMTTLTSQGYTPVQAAGIVGNAQYESANFTAHEEFEPNAYGTKGAGVFQWTNAGGSNRRDNFESWSASQGLDPKSFEANSGFMLHEMQGNAGNHWTGGMNDQGYRQIGDLNTAVTSFQNNYLRPNKDAANTQQRLTYAQQALQNWQNRNS